MFPELSKGRLNLTNLNMLLVYPDMTDKLANELKQQFNENGLNIGRIEVRATKALLNQYLEANKDVNVVIMAQHLKGEEFSPDDIDRVSMLVPEAIIILITDEEKGSAYVVNLERKAIYNALFNDDGDIGSIASLIRKPRSKSEARIYYGITHSENKGAGGDTGFNPWQSVNYIEGGSSDFDELSFRLDTVASKVSASELVEIFAGLDEDILSLAGRLDRYKEVSRLALEKIKNKRRSEREAAERVDATVEEVTKRKPKKEKKRKKEKKKEVKEPLDKSKKAIEVGFISDGAGVGCTYQAVLAANSYQRNGLKAAIVEIDNSENNFAALCKFVNKTGNINGLNSFTINGVDYFFDLTMPKFRSLNKLKYDVVIYDFGCCSDAVIAKYVVPLQVVFAVCSGCEWKYAEVSEFYQAMSCLDKSIKFRYLFPLVSSSELGAYKKLLGKNELSEVDFEPNSYAPSVKTQKMFLSFLDRDKKRKPVTYKDVDFDKKVSKKASRSGLNTAVVVLSVLLLGSITGVVASNIISRGTQRRLVSAYNEEISLRNNKINELSESLEELSNLQDTYETTVLMLKEPCSAGSAITRDMVKEVTISTSLDKSLYLTMDDIDGRVAASNLSADTPIYSYFVAKPIVDVLPAEADMPAASGESAADAVN